MIKKLLPLLFLIPLFITSCDDNRSTETQANEEVENTSKSNEWEVISIHDGGFNLNMKVPSEEIAGGKSEVSYLEDLGELEIRVGNTFDLLVFEDESQIEMMKNEIANHPFYNVELVIENDSSLLYRYFTEDGSKEQWHTYVEKKYGNGTLLIRSNENEEFSEYETKKMLESALSITPAK